MNRAFVQANQPAFAIGVFLVVYCGILWLRPAFLYNKDVAFGSSVWEIVEKP